MCSPPLPVANQGMALAVSSSDISPIFFLGSFEDSLSVDVFSCCFFSSSLVPVVVAVRHWWWSERLDLELHGARPGERRGFPAMDSFTHVRYCFTGALLILPYKTTFRVCVRVSRFYCAFVRSSRFRPTCLCVFVRLSVRHVFDPRQKKACVAC